MDSERYRGKVVIVTGAGSGIGRATVNRLAGEGARVIGCDVDDKGLHVTAGQLAKDSLSADLLVADVTKQADVEAVIAEAGNRVDLLANVAGIMDHFLPLGEIDDDTWFRVMGVNIDGVMRMTRAVLPLMQQQESGAIVTVASEASLRGGSAGVAYTCSKHAVIGLVQHVAYFYGPLGIRSNAVLPGPVATGIGSSAEPRSEWAMKRAMQSLAVMGPVAQPVSIATAISWLGCEEAANVNGAILSADGGWSAA